MFTLLNSCVSSLRRGHANLLCIVPSLTIVCVCVCFVLSCQGASQLATAFATFEENLLQTSSARQVIPPDVRHNQINKSCYHHYHYQQYYLRQTSSVIYIYIHIYIYTHTCCHMMLHNQRQTSGLPPIAVQGLVLSVEDLHLDEAPYRAVAPSLV